MWEKLLKDLVAVGYEKAALQFGKRVRNKIHYGIARSEYTIGWHKKWTPEMKELKTKEIAAAKEHIQKIAELAKKYKNEHKEMYMKRRKALADYQRQKLEKKAQKLKAEDEFLKSDTTSFDYKFQQIVEEAQIKKDAEPSKLQKVVDAIKSEGVEAVMKGKTKDLKGKAAGGGKKTDQASANASTSANAKVEKKTEQKIAAKA